jgi:cell division protein FtsQ
MEKEQRAVRQPQRVYDRLSGEYRPAPANARYAAALRAENRERHRRQKLRLFYFFTFLLVIGAAAVLSLTVLFKIDTIRVTGTSRYTQDQIIAASGIQKGDNLFLTKTKEAGQRVLGQLPYVGSVKVARALPATIEITVGAEAASGAVPFGGKYAVLGSELKVLELAGSLPPGCALIKGVELQKAQPGAKAVLKNSSQADAFQNTVSVLAKNQLDGITQMDFSSLSKIQFTYQNRVVIDIGLPDNLDYKIRYAKNLFDTGKIKSTEKGTLNLSVAPENDTAYFDPDYGSSKP